MWMRGGTSKGAYFLAEDLPFDTSERDALLLSIMGSPDENQIDGIGGAHPLRSKVAIVERSKEPGIDIDFVFAQVAVTEPLVDTTPNCGNILAGVAPFAIERGLVKAQDGETTVRVRTVNTGTVADLVVRTPGGVVSYAGEGKIDGVPGTSAPIKIDFLDVAGSVCGTLLPSGSARDIVDGVPVTCIDNGMPVVVISAAELGRTGYENVDSLNSDGELKTRIERIRLAAGKLMGLGEVSQKVVPKVSLIAPGQHGGAVSTRTFIPHACHTSIGVFGAVSVATACVLPGSVAASIAQIPPGDDIMLSIEHPTGEFTVHLEMEDGTVKRAGLLRTARKLFDGVVYPREV
jgi:4-oxalomesaconate tautomerase